MYTNFSILLASYKRMNFTQDIDFLRRLQIKHRNVKLQLRSMRKNSIQVYQDKKEKTFINGIKTASIVSDIITLMSKRLTKALLIKIQKVLNFFSIQKSQYVILKFLVCMNSTSHATELLIFNLLQNKMYTKEHHPIVSFHTGLHKIISYIGIEMSSQLK